MALARKGAQNFKNSKASTRVFAGGFRTTQVFNKGNRGRLTALRASAVEDAEIVDEEKPKVGLYSWFVLMIILLIRVAYQWQRSIFSYCYGYAGLGAQAGNPIFEIGKAYPELAGQFGFLTGFAYTIPFAFGGLYFGKITDKLNRKWCLGIAMALCGISMGVSGFATSFMAFALMRPVLGTISAIFNPLSFSLLSEYFPPERRATANSIIQSGNYIGWGVSSISIMAISALGWRSTYGLLGVVAMVIAAMTVLFVKEP